MNVSIPSMLCMGLAGLIGFAIPPVLCIWLRKKKRADLLPFFIGMAVFFVFALVLETLLHQIVLNAPVGKVIQGNIWLYALYGGLAAGVFEETGRFLAFKTVLKKYQARDVNALMYGAGHGGCEAALLFGATMVSNLVLSVMLNTGMSDLVTKDLQGAQLTQMEDVFRTLCDTSAPAWFLGLLERVIAVALHMALTIPVWFAAKDAKRGILFPLAILLHFLVDAATVVLSGTGLPALAVEGILACMTAAIVLFAWLLWKKYHTEPAVEDFAPAEAESAESAEDPGADLPPAAE